MMKFLTAVFCTILFCTANLLAQPGELLSVSAKAQFEKQNFAPCIAEMSKIIVAQPKNDAALVERARCLFLSADDTNDEKVIFAEVSKKILDKEKAQSAVIDEVLSRRNKAVDDATKAIALNPKNANAFNIRGLVKSSLGRKAQAEAIADFDKAIEIDPKFIKPYFNRGQAKAEMNDNDGAIADYTKVIELEPNNIVAILSRVRAKIRKNKYERSVEIVNELRKIIKLSPPDELSFLLAGGECFKFDYDYQCADIFEQYIKAFPNSPPAYLGLAQANTSVERYYNLENKELYWKAAETAYLKFIELRPNEIEAYVQLFDLYYDKLRSKIDAKVMAVRTFAKFPNNPQSSILNGKMAESNNDWATAVKEFSRAIELNPKFSLAYERRSNAYLGLKDDDKAMADLNKAVELDSDNGSAYLNRGNHYSKYKKYQQAIADFTEADKLKETCAKTYRGIMYTSIANENKEARDTGNFTAAQRDFLADDAQKCYLTNYMYGISLYSQGFNEQAAKQFDYALTVYKKQGYDTTEVVEWQNRVKSTTSNPQVNPSNSAADIRELMDLFTKKGFGEGGKLVGSSDWNSNSEMVFKVESGQSYVFVAIKEYDPAFGIDIIYNDRLMMRPTHRFDDNAYEVSDDAQYAMKSDTSKIRNLSSVRMNVSITKKSNIRTIKFSPKTTGGKVHWLCFRLK